MRLFPGIKDNNEIEFGLIALLAYLGSLIFLWIKTGDLLAVLLSHLLFVSIYSIFHFGRDFLFIVIAPVFVILTPINNYFIKRYLKNFKQNVPAEAVIVLAHSDWRKLEAWIKPNFFTSELKAVTKYLIKKKREFSFYTNASLEDIDQIMLNKDIKEVFFFGHGNSHAFQLGSEDILYYCDFNRQNHEKEFVHQMHCGTSHGKSLADYVVAEGNKSNCFLIRKPITAYDIEKDLKNRTQKLT